METSKIRFGFKSDTQLPFFMVWKEWSVNGEVTMGKVLFTTSHWGF